MATKVQENTGVELFAGVGGFNLGLGESGWKTIFANQWEPGKKSQWAFDCYNEHFPESTNLNVDVATVDSKDIPGHELLVGGFPCQDYSVASTLINSKGIQGKKGVLWWEIYRIATDKRPRFILLENVDRLLKSPAKQRGRDFGIILACLSSLGYSIEWRVINAADYGFPQRRRRTFIFATSDKNIQKKLYGRKTGDEILLKDGFALEAKSTAVGVRLEQPQSLIDSIQYHAVGKRSSFLPPASYSFKTQVNGRGVYSFCMCPGGSVVPASTEDGLLVINGMSPASRRGRWANSGMITEIRKEEIDGDDPFRVMRYIESIERSSFIPGFIAPAERMTDFCFDRPSGTLAESTYRPGLKASRLDDILPPVVVSSLRAGFLAFSDMTRGRFLTADGTVIAAETRTSSPVRILRDDSMHQGRGLYPAGEGAGYAGGIVSAAIDGSEAALSLRRDFNG